MRRFNLNVEVRDAKRNQDYKAELEQRGGKLKVPCLRIEEQGGVNLYGFVGNDGVNWVDYLGAGAVSALQARAHNLAQYRCG